MPIVPAGILSTPRTTEFGLGRSNSAGMRHTFPSSPFYATENPYDDVSIRSTFFNSQEIREDVATGRYFNDQSYAYGEIPIDYQDAPNLLTVQVGVGGLPASPYGPNIAVRSLNPTDTNEMDRDSPSTVIDGTIRVANMIARNSGIQANNTLVSPSQTSANIGRRTLGGNLANGVGSGNSFRNRT